MRRITFLLVIFASFALPVSAQSVDEIVGRYLKTIGGMEKIQAVQTLRRTGKYIGGGGFEAVITQENKRGNSVREEFSLQGMTAINAYDGKTGWKIEPWNGKKDPEALGEEEMKSIVANADFDGPLVNYKPKGNKVEFIGMDRFEGTDTFKLKITTVMSTSTIWTLTTTSQLRSISNASCAAPSANTRRLWEITRKSPAGICPIHSRPTSKEARTSRRSSMKKSTPTFP